MNYSFPAREIPRELRRDLLRKMFVVARFEESLANLQKEGLIHGSVHLCEGEEAASVGSTAALNREDCIFTTHRGHGEAIGKGADISRMMAEILGRTGSSNGGIGGSMHITDPEAGVVGSNGVVGAGVPIALGAALAIKLRNIPDRVSACFFGDGAANQGAVLESMNLAGVRALPVVFVLINNEYAVSTRVEKASADPDFVKRAVPFGLKPFEADGNDVEEVFRVVAEAREFTAGGAGPSLVVLHTYRLSPHSRSDDSNYRSGAEINLRRESEPIRRYVGFLTENAILNAGEIGRIERGAEEEVREAIDYALRRPEADLTAAELERAVYAD